MTEAAKKQFESGSGDELELVMKSGRIRHELKFLIDASQKRRLLERWGHLLIRDQYTDRNAVTHVLSRYYDSPELDFYREKGDGIPLRNKVRLRAYGHSINPGDTVFLEIKQRLGDRVRKYRQRIDYYQKDYENIARWKYDGRAADGLLGSLISKFRLAPSAQVWYQREAYSCVIDPDVRVTFDSEIRAMHPGERLTGDIVSDGGRFILPESVFVLEVKLSGKLPGWVSDAVRTIGLVQTTVPKYILAVEKLNFGGGPPSGA